jgi:ABC-2 type transport system ATP-binding protein
MNKADIDTFLKQFDEIFNDEIIGKKKYLRDLSKGNQKKVGIVAALIGNPEVIILDEPFANLDPTTQIRLKKILKELTQKSHATILVSSHDLGHVTEVCERIVVLEKGEIVKDIYTSEETLKELETYFSV